jgi:hypothetical protein
MRTIFLDLSFCMVLISRKKALRMYSSDSTKDSMKSTLLLVEDLCCDDLLGEIIIALVDFSEGACTQQFSHI